LANPKSGGDHQKKLNHELGILNIQRQIHELYAEKVKEFVTVESAWREAELELKDSKMSLLLVEGKTDKSIIETAWGKTRGDLMPFRIRVADPAADGSTAGTGMLAKTIEGVHPEDGRCCVALFDCDAEGIKAFNNLSKNFSVTKELISLKVHVNKLSYAMLLPAPEFRQQYVDANNHMIEFMFSDEVLEKKVDGYGLRFKKTDARIIVNGEQIAEPKQFLLPGIATEFSAYRKIHDGKDHFAEKIVSTLPAEEFSAFELLFSQLAQVPNFFAKPVANKA
jgi:hypothetical protein